MLSTMLAAAVMLLAVADVTAQEQPPAAQLGSTATAWPQFRGPGRNGISSETGLLQRWPEGGPKVLWQVSGLGRGYSSPIITEHGLFITGDVAADELIFAYDLNGTLKWKVANGRAWKGPYPGARATCTYDRGRLYHMNAHGRAACISTADGGTVWTVDVLGRFQARNIRWGISECLLLDGNRVVVTPGGKSGFIAALDKDTGETVWCSEPLRFSRTHAFGGKPVEPPVPDTDKAGYASPILFEMNNRRLIAGASARHLFCVDADTGKFVWTHPVFARYEVIGAMPTLTRDAIFFSAPDAFGSRLFRIEATPESVTLHEQWETAADNCHGASVLVGGRLYGAGYRRFKDWVCIDIETGDIRYSLPGLRKGSIVYADNRLYALSESGTMALLKATETQFETVGQFDITPTKSKDAWAHPVICNGRLYLRYHNTLTCYDIRALTAPAAE